jgi:hypothetical protein
MPIGAVIGGAVIGAGGSIIAGSQSASAQKKAAQTAATSAQNTTEANNALFRENKAQNIAIAQPFYNNGVTAGNALQSLLLGSPSAAPSPAPTSSTGALQGYQTNPGYQVGPVNSAPVSSALSNYGKAAGFRENFMYGTSPEDGVYDSPAQARYYAAQAAQPAATTPAATTGTPAPATTQGALSPWDQFRNGTNYQWRYDQGLKATEGAYATKGALDSGAAEKAKITFGQNFASNELSNYMNLLAGQQNVGLSAGNAIMGVSTSAANAIAGQNTNAGNVAANAALVGGQASANMWGTVGQTAGQLGGALFQYGMNGLNRPAATPSLSSYYSQPAALSFGPATPAPYTGATLGTIGF